MYESCDQPTVWQGKIVAGSAPTLNIVAGLVLWIILRKARKLTSEAWFLLWLLMMMNLCYGAGYFMLSGIANIGDWAVVIEGWELNWLWRVLMAVGGVLLFIIFLHMGLVEFGKMVGGDGEEQIRRTNKLWIWSYVTSFAVVVIAGFFCPYGPLSLPVTAGVFAVLGALSPFIWMIRWFRTKRFVKLVKEPLEIHRKWQWISASVIVVIVYTFILGRTLYF